MLETGGELVARVAPADRRRASRWLPPPLPPDTPLYTGRVRELARMDELAADGQDRQPMLLTGTAGVGKTALALHWAHRQADRFPDGALFADLRGFGPTRPTDPFDVLDGFLRQLGVDPKTLPTTLHARSALFRTVCAGRRLVVILDNAARPESVRPLLPGVPGCATIVTSRHRLEGLVVRNSATAVPVERLDRADAIDLLVKAAGDDAADPAAADIVEYCARLPLAIRIAAQRASAGTLRTVARELATLSSRMDELSVDDGETAVRAVFSWSYDALPAATARVFRLLGAFPATEYSVAAVAALCDVSTTAARSAVDGLVAGHLAERAPSGALTLHDLMRAYAAELATGLDQPEDVAAARCRLLSWYLHTAHAATAQLIPRRIRFALQPAVSEPLAFADREAALAWCEAERVNLTAAVTAAWKDGDDPTCWHLAGGLDAYFMVAKRWDEWLASHTVALAAARRLGDRTGEAFILTGLGAAYGDLHRFDESLLHLRAALDLRVADGDLHGAAATHLNLGALVWQLGDNQASLVHGKQALAIFEELGDSYGQGTVLNNLGAINAQLGNADEAVAQLTRSLALFQESGNTYGTATALSTLGDAYHRAGALDAAIESLTAALDLRRTIGFGHNTGVTLQILAEVYEDAGRPDDAVEALREALALFEELASPLAEDVSTRLSRLTLD